MEDQPVIGGDTSYPTESFSSGGAVPFVTPYLVQTGVTRGSQKIVNTDGSYVVTGQIPGTNDFGIAFFDVNNNRLAFLNGTEMVYYDSSGNVLQTISEGTTIYHDPINNVNSIIIGKLPNGIYGWVVATPGNDISEVF